MQTECPQGNRGEGVADFSSVKIIRCDLLAKLVV